MKIPYETYRKDFVMESFTERKVIRERHDRENKKVSSIRAKIAKR
jgi:hypothetical protein